LEVPTASPAKSPQRSTSVNRVLLGIGGVMAAC
jgi:hypothetical protein